MAAGKRVILTFKGGGEGADAAQLTIRTELFASACQYLMAVCLMTHVPYDAVFRRVIDVVQRHRQLYNTQTGRQVSGIDRQLFDDVLA